MNMKRSGAMFTWVVILFISVNFVSANWFDDVLNRVTGKVTDNDTVEPECPSIPISELCPDEETLCPQTTDEQGCSVWDCDSCEEEVICADDVRECWDGSYASRNLNNNCEFDPCPPELETCAAKIEINFDKTSYVVGERFEAKMGVFDLQGNPLADYLFYVKMHDDRGHTPGQERTGADGYVKRTGTIDELPGGATKAIFNIYTEETNSCSKVEDTTEIEVEPGSVPSEPKPMPEPDEPPYKPETCATKIKIKFDKNIYYVGKEFKVALGVFDTQGNPIPNIKYIKIK